jgi:hypothetical protein
MATAATLGGVGPLSLGVTSLMRTDGVAS